MQTKFKIKKIEKKIENIEVRPVSNPTDFYFFVKLNKDIFEQDFIKYYTHESKLEYLNSCVNKSEIMHLIWAGDEAIGVFALFQNIELGADTELYSYLSGFGLTKEYRYRGIGKGILKKIIAENPRLVIQANSELRAKMYSSLGLYKIALIEGADKWQEDDYVLSLEPDILKRTKYEPKKLSDTLYDYADFDPEMVLLIKERNKKLKNIQN